MTTYAIAQAEKDRSWHLLDEDGKPLCRTRKALERTLLPKALRDPDTELRRLPRLEELEALCPDCHQTALTRSTPEPPDYRGREKRDREMAEAEVRYLLTTAPYAQGRLERDILEIAERLERAAQQIRQQHEGFCALLAHPEATDRDRTRAAQHLAATAIEETTGVAGHSNLGFLFTEVKDYEREVARVSGRLSAYEAAYPGITQEIQPVDEEPAA